MMNHTKVRAMCVTKKTSFFCDCHYQNRNNVDGVTRHELDPQPHKVALRWQNISLLSRGDPEGRISG